MKVETIHKDSDERRGSGGADGHRKQVLWTHR